MAGRFPRSVVWILVGVLMFVVGGALVYEAGAATLVETYTVTVSANSNIRWTLTLPRPLGAYIPLESPNVTGIQTLSTVHGEMYLITGQGSGSAWFTAMTSYYDLNSYTAVQAAAPGFNQTGFTTAWVERASSNASQAIRFSGTTAYDLSPSAEQDLCSGYTFSGSLAEGWNALDLGLGGCVHTTPLPSLLVLSAPFLVVGLACTYVGIDRGLKFHWER